MKNLNKWKLIVVLFIIAIIIMSVCLVSANVAKSKTSSDSSNQNSLKELENSEIAKQKIQTIKARTYQGEAEEEEVSIEDFNEEEIKTENLDTKPAQTNSPSPAVKNVNPYYIKINNSANVVTIYSKDSEGNYTIPVKAMVCSTGRATPSSGRYQTGYKARWIRLFGGVHGQYSTKIVGNILFHSVPYLRYGDPASLEYWEFDKLGTSCSMGCVRLCVADAKWIYDNIGSGTIVEFYSASDPGPLGKPGMQKISSNLENRDWDPTDPDQNSPWKKSENSSDINSILKDETSEGSVENTNTDNSLSPTVSSSPNESSSPNTKTSPNINDDVSPSSNQEPVSSPSMSPTPSATPSATPSIAPSVTPSASPSSLPSSSTPPVSPSPSPSSSSSPSAMPASSPSINVETE